MPIVKADCMVSMPMVKFLFLEDELKRLREKVQALQIQIRVLEEKEKL